MLALIGHMTASLPPNPNPNKPNESNKWRKSGTLGLMVFIDTGGVPAAAVDMVLARAAAIAAAPTGGAG